MMNLTKMALTNTMMIGVIMTVCSNNWISMWMGLELALLSFIPVMSTNNKETSQSMMKYFIIQTISSTMFLFSVICMLIGVNIMNEMIMTISMLIKLGVVPFHNWILLMIEPIDYMTLFKLFTIIKIPPMFIISQTQTEMMQIIIMFSLIVSSISCFNQSSMKKILGFSSIFNVTTMISSMHKVQLMMIYISLYSMILLMLVINLMKLKINFINQTIFNEFSNSIKLSLWINMLSLSGFPPLAGFFIKIMIIQELMSMNHLMISMSLILSSIMMMFLYTRIAFLMMFNFYLTKKWNKFESKSNLSTMTLNIIMFPMAMTLKVLL